MKKILGIFLALVLVLSFSLITAVPVSAQITEVWVDDDAPSSWYDATHLATIQGGVNAVGIGGTVHVLPGTYTENVVVNKSVTLQSAKKHKAVVVGASYAGDVFRISATGATVEGFHVRIAQAHDGIAVKANGVTVRNNKVTGPGPFTGYVAPTGAGISAMLCDDVTIENNDVRYTTGGGIWIGSTTNSLISKNHVEGTQYTGILITDYTYFVGLGSTPSHGNLIAENRVKNCGTLWNHDDGIRLGYAANNNVVWKNDVKGSANSGIRAVPAAFGNTIVGNKMTGSQGLAGGFDAHDMSSGTRTANTANWWAGNKGKTENPTGLLK